MKSVEPPFEKNLIDRIKDLLIQRHQTISVAESVTAGLLQLSLSSAENALDFFQGGITAYNLGQKTRHLHIDPIYALSCNCVSDRVADLLALNVCDLFSSDWGIGITGYASPVPESNNKLYCHYSIAYQDEIVTRKKIDAAPGDPYQVQIIYVQEVTEALLGCLEKNRT
jgi:nicotinamide-nucleotide amidase